MKNWNAAAVALFGIISGGAHAIDLTPREVAASNDGPIVKRYFFQDGTKRVSFGMDNKMTVSGANDAATFGFGDVTGASMKLSRSPFAASVPFAEKNLEAYRAAARAVVPPDATDILLVEEKPNPITINGWTSQQFVFSYNLFGMAKRRAVTFLNLSAQEQLVYDVSSSTGDFDSTSARGFRVLNSIADLPASGDFGPT